MLLGFSIRLGSARLTVRLDLRGLSNLNDFMILNELEALFYDEGKDKPRNPMYQKKKKLN